MKSRSSEGSTPDHKLTTVLTGVGIALCVAPCVAALCFVHTYGTNVPFLDEWHFAADHFTKWCEGTLTIADLWKQHHEHRIVFPRLLWLLVACLTRYHTVAFLYVIQFLYLCIAAALFGVYRTQFRSAMPWIAWWGFVPVMWLLFAFRQWESMLVAFQTTVLLTLASASTALLLLTNVADVHWRALVRFGLAVLLAVVATFSCSMGLLVWMPGLLLLLLPVARPVKWLYAGVWIAAGLVCWACYFHHYVTPPTTTDYAILLRRPALVVEYLLTCMGGALFWYMPRPWLAGVLLMTVMGVAHVLAIVHRRWQANRFWWALALYALLIMLAIAVGRAGLGLALALSSRYSTFPLVTMSATYVVLLDLSLYARSRLALAFCGLVVAALLWSAVPMYRENCANAKRFQSVQQRNAFLLTSFDEVPDDMLASIHPAAFAVRLARDTMQRFDCGFMRYKRRCMPFPPSVTTPDVSRLQPSETAVAGDICINNEAWRFNDQVLTLAPGQNFIFLYGWAVDEAARRPAGAVLLYIDDQCIPLFSGGCREDIGQLYGTACKYSQFEAFIPVTMLGPGTHRVRVLFLTHDKTRYWWYPASAMVHVP